jgi:hypothetical protein
MGFLAIAICIAGVVVLNFAEEEHKRARSSKLRKFKKDRQNLRSEIVKLSHDQNALRNGNEFIRRGCLGLYYRSQALLIDEAISILNSTSHETYQFKKNVKEILELRGNERTRDYISDKLWSDLNDELIHMGGLVFSKHEVMVKLLAAKKEIEPYLSSEGPKGLFNRQTHGKLGAKKHILELLDNQDHVYKNLFREKESKGRAFWVGELVLKLTHKCRSCGSWQDEHSVACFICGEDIKGKEVVLKFSKEDSSADFSCGNCKAPAGVEMRHCFNCGKKIDHYGLIAVTG